MTDQEIIQALIARDNKVTEEFFFVKCRKLFCRILQKVFDYEVDYNEMVNELYQYLMQDDAHILRNFQYRSSVYQWLKVIAIRFFINNRGGLIDDTSKENPLDWKNLEETNADASADGDIERLLNDMPNKRFVYVIRRLILDDWEPEKLAQEMNITTANLYNIKRRAMAQLTRTALKDLKEYGKRELY